MFDISFSELTLIAVVALVVIGPERLPAVARTMGKWVGKMQRFVSTVKADIDRELKENEELKQLVEEQKELQETHQILEKTVGDLNQPTPVPSTKPSLTTKPAAAPAETENKILAAPPAAGKPEADTKQTHG